MALRLRDIGFRMLLFNTEYIYIINTEYIYIIHILHIIEELYLMKSSATR
jgi:hypothetical protein